jgi:hypothetical protein
MVLQSICGGCDLSHVTFQLGGLGLAQRIAIQGMIISTLAAPHLIAVVDRKFRQFHKVVGLERPLGFPYLDRAIRPQAPQLCCAAAYLI